MKTRLTFLFIAVLILLPSKLLEAQTLRYNYRYMCKGERIIVVRCRKDSDQPGFDPTPPEKDYCAVVYPDRPKQGGIQVETVELRAEVMKTLQACDAFGAGASRPANTSSTASSVKTTTTSTTAGSAEYYLAEGNKYREAKDYTKAVASFKRAVALKPSLTYGHFYLGYCYYTLKQYQDALTAFRETVRLEPNDNSYHYWVGVTHYQMKHYPEALSSLQQAIRIKADDAYGHYWLGQTYANGFKEYAKAINETREAIRLKSDDPVFHNGLGLSYASLERLEDAAAEYNEAIRLDPNTGSYRNNLGILYVEMGMKEKALETQQALQRIDAAQAKELGEYIHAIFPEEFKDEGILSYAIVTGAISPGASLPLYRRAILLKPTPEELARIYCGMGDAYKELEETASEAAAYKQAVTMYKRLIQQNPRKPDLQYFLGHSYLGLGQKEQAVIIQKRLVRLDPKYAKSLLDEINETK